MTDADPQNKNVLPQFRLKINGADAKPELMRDVIDVVVDQRMHLPTMFEIRINLLPYDLNWLDGATLDAGKEIEILAGYSGQEKSLVIGKVTSIEPNLDEQLASLTIRGYDFSFGLHRGVKNRSFLDVTDSDLASKLGQEAGLSVEAETTTETYKYLFQHSQTNYEFLLNRARRIGYELVVEAKKLHFRKPLTNPPATKLEWGVNLIRFQPRLSVAEQVNEVGVRGWDVQAKQSIIGQATNGHGAPTIGVSKPGGSFAKEVWGDAKRLIADHPVVSQGEALKMAQAVLDDLTSAYVQASGLCNGEPALKVGGQTEVAKVGTKFAGKYYLTSVKHSISPEGYLTSFTACSRNPDAISTMLVAPERRPVAPTLVIGLVTNNKDDPDKIGRVKVKFPWLDDDQESWWCRLATPMAGNEMGYLTFPEVNDEVLVGFEHGDFTRGFILGGLWNGKDLPPKGNKELVGGDGKVNQRIWRSRTGHLIILDDSDSAESIQIIDKTEKNHIIITSSDNKLDVLLDGDIVVTSKTGNISMTAEKDITIESKTGNIRVTAQQDITTESKTGMISITAMKDVKTESKTAKIAMKCIDAELTANASAKMTANTTFDIMANATVSVKGNGQAEFSSVGQTKLGGTMVDVQGSAMTNITGGLVKIN